MPVKRNGFYNDPALGQAFSNLSDIFAPPSGSDMAGYATAQATREKAQRLADLFSYARDPNYDQTTADRLGVLGGLYAPNQSYYAVNTEDATKRRGQDVEAQTSRSNNAADNARELQQTQMTQTGDTARTLLSPVAQGATRFVPPQIADLFSVPQTQVGGVSVNPGETVVTADGRTINGAPKPLTDAEVKGAILQQLPPADQRNVATQGVPVEQIINPTTNKPEFVTRNDAVGQQPYVKTTPSELGTLQAERDALPAGDPRRQEYDARIQALGRGQQQGAYDKANDEDLAKLNSSIFDNAKGALADQHTYSTILAAVNNPNVDQGSLANATLSLRKYLGAFGVNAGDTGPAEMLNALGNQIALQLRNPNGGAGMPGSLSDSDREFLRSMSVSLGNTQSANRLLAQYYIASQQRSIDLNNLRAGYVAQHGRLDEGFRQQMADYLKNNDPTAGIKAQVAGGVPAPGAPAPNPGGTATSAPAAAPAVEKWDFVNGKLQRVN